MLAKRIVPLIVAVALFMENMDSTVIATSLPAIAADIGTSPLTLKLAVTAYLLSLAVFIPVSGWTADRFGARTVFRSAIAVFMLGSIGCALSNSLAEFVAARIVEGMGGAMMTPVARLILVRSVDRRELINAMVWVTLPALVGLWKLVPGQIGFLISAGYIGQIVGAVFFGWFAERYGRIKALVGSVAILSLLSLACAFSWNYESLLVFRTLQGIGLGGEVPIAAAYIRSDGIRPARWSA